MTLTFPDSRRASSPAADLLIGERLAVMHGRNILPVEIFRILNAAKLKAVLVGAHAVNAHSGDPRTTVDVDILGDKPKRLAAVLSAAYPMLTVEEHPVVIRLKDAEHEAIDIIRPESSKLFKRVLKLSQVLLVEGVEIAIPKAEALLAMKFSSMISVGRQLRDRYVDAGDFVAVAQQTKRLDQSLLAELGEIVYVGGSKELLQHIANAKDEKRLDI